MKILGLERRKRRRTNRPTHVDKFRIALDSGSTLAAELLDISSVGLAVKTSAPLAMDSFVVVSTTLVSGRSRREIHSSARVVCCFPLRDDGYRVGLSFWGLSYENPFFGLGIILQNTERAQSPRSPEEEFSLA